MNSHLVRLDMEEEGKVRAAASCRFEKREKELGCWLIDLIGEKKRYCCSSLLATRLEKKERVVLFGGGNKIRGLLLACCRSMEEFREISSCC
jgi:hypothetical protein